MSTYSVADAKNHLPSLIDKALAGEEVVITRHGKPVVELRTATAPPERMSAASLEALRAWRKAHKPSPISSVELLRQLYEEE
ncbi:MAG TPA: type II toxin-antitoxin system prevent-host-death family antitoxin [Acetobacteraceae bacterium]